jgi:hypothetical protein
MPSPTFRKLLLHHTANRPISRFQSNNLPLAHPPTPAPPATLDLNPSPAAAPPNPNPNCQSQQKCVTKHKNTPDASTTGASPPKLKISTPPRTHYSLSPPNRNGLIEV